MPSIPLEIEIAVLKEKISGLERERAIQVIELARRLDELNHVHQRAIEDRSFFLPRDIFEAYEKERTVWSHNITKSITECIPRAEFNQSQKSFEDWKSSISEIISEARGKGKIIAGLYGTGAALVVGLILRYWK